MGQIDTMSRGQRLAVLVAAANLILIWVFPPYDYVSPLQGNIPTFEGFFFRFADNRSRLVNGNFLALEIIVVLINWGIAWMLIRHAARVVARRRSVNRAQRILLAGVGINLILMVLFPPFENFVAISKAVLPTFEGFYFVFGDNSQRVIVTPLLYLEVTLVLINACLLWLFLRDRGAAQLSRLERDQLILDLQRAQKRNQSL